MKKLASLFAVFAALFAATFMLAPTGAEAQTYYKSCRTLMITGLSPLHYTKRFAERDAVRAWQARVNRRYGRPYTNPRYAMFKKMSCWLHDRRRSVWRCMMEAKPCRLVPAY